MDMLIMVNWESGRKGGRERERERKRESSHRLVVSKPKQVHTSTYHSSKVF